jgi:N-acetylmuramic acid 6-phosphate etherase
VKPQRGSPRTVRRSSSDRGHLLTEQANPRSADLDALSTREIVELISAEDGEVIGAVRAEAAEIARAADLAAASFGAGGRLVYVGAGTSGRLGVLDAAECIPTFGAPRGQVVGVIAGGREALVGPVEFAEDDPAAGAAEMTQLIVGAKDTVVGIATGGTTPFVVGALAEAKRRGAGTVFLHCTHRQDASVPADVVIAPLVGPEVLTGSTRMKAGTATKLVLNSISTAAFVRLGKVYGNLMVDLVVTNAKLADRAERIVMAVVGCERARARGLLAAAGGRCKTALVMGCLGLDRAAAESRLARFSGRLREALARHGLPRE